MEKKELIFRKTNSFDKRSKMVFLTDRGKEIRQNIDEHFHKITQEFVNEIETSNLNQTKDVLEKILDNLVSMKKKSIFVNH